MKFFNKCFTLILFTNILGHTLKSDYTYVQNVDGYFKYHNVPATWHNAQLRCQYEGAILASPHPVEIYNTLLELMNDRGSYDDIFIGINALISKGDYNTIDGTPLNQISVNWTLYEPDKHNNEEECLIFTPKGLIADKRCDHPYPYYCYKEKKTGPKDSYISPCGTSDRGYKYSIVTRSCYKFHKEPQKWSEASTTCASEGGYLAIINSDLEAEVIRQLWKKNPEDEIPGNFWKVSAFIGFRDWAQTGNWTTIHGYTLSEAGYDQFGPYEPNNNDNVGEYCGSVFRSGLLNDAPCFFPMTSICIKSGST